VNSSSVETILVVEDNQALREGLVLNFRNRGYGVDSAEDGCEGMHKAMATRPDLIVLDIMLPGRNGLDILTELRRKGRKVPVLILSARSRTDDKVEGLSSGADDYLAKPFELPELMARVEVMLRRRRAEPARDKRVTFGPVAIHRERCQVFVEGREIELSVKEFGVLDYLAEAPGRPRTREEILDRVWGWDFEGSARTVDNFIVSLRQKLEREPGRPRHIVTVRGMGYKLLSEGAS
jgi:two-component system alkaline phosphatase synthesis response regulator PhoP